MKLALKSWYQGCQFGRYAMQAVANSKWSFGPRNVNLQHLLAKKYVEGAAVRSSTTGTAQ